MALERIICGGAVDGWKPGRIKNAPEYAQIFKDIRSNTFRVRVARLREQQGKSTAGGITKPAKNKLKLQRMSTEPKVAPVVEEADEEEILNSVDADDDYGDIEVASEDERTPLSPREDHRIFKPIYSICYWDDPSDNYNPCFSGAISAFSGVDRQSDFSIHVTENKFLEYIVIWPVVLTSAQQLHAVWLTGKGKREKIAEYHSMVTCFEPMLSKMRRHDQRVQTVARIPLKMHVESRPEVHLLSYPGSSAKIIYVILRGTARRTAILDDQALAWEQ